MIPVCNGPTDSDRSIVGAITTPEQSGGPTSNLGKDEVAWFFVEQYYTTLSKTPEKLHVGFGPPFTDLCSY